MPLVMLHGLMGRPENWQGVLPSLPTDCRALALRFPLFCPEMRLNSVKAIVRHTLDFLDSSGEDFVICGNSLGGHVAIDVALERPHKVRGLVLAGSSGLFERSFTAVPGIHPPRTWVEEKVREVFFDPIHATADIVDETCWVIKNHLRALISLAVSAKRDHVAKRLKDISCPTLLIWGREDAVTPPDVAEEFARLLPSSELQWIEQCGHAPMIERPEEFGLRVADWWRRNISNKTSIAMN